MSFFGIFGFGKKIGGPSLSTGRSKKYYIVDCSMMESSKGERGRLAPRNQVDQLRRLSRFAKKEQIEMCAVFPGRELRDAPDGGKFMDVMVSYTEEASDLPQFIASICSKQRGAALVITSDKAVEQVVRRQGAEVMHCSTFRKALESDGGSSSGERGDRGERGSGRPERPQNRRGGRSNGFGSRRPPRPNNNTEPVEHKEEPDDSVEVPAEEEKAQSRSPKNDADSVSDLIDLV